MRITLLNESHALSRYTLVVFGQSIFRRHRRRRRRRRHRRRRRRRRHHRRRRTEATEAEIA